MYTDDNVHITTLLNEILNLKWKDLIITYLRDIALDESKFYEDPHVFKILQTLAWTVGLL